MTQFVRRRRACQTYSYIYLSQYIHMAWGTARHRYVCYASWGVVPQKGLRTQSTLMEAALNAASSTSSPLSRSIIQSLSQSVTESLSQSVSRRRAFNTTARCQQILEYDKYFMRTS